MISLSRRDFMHRAAAIAALGLLPRVTMAAARNDDFTFPLLGDTHYDRLTDHAMDWLQASHPGDVNQVRNYSRITSENTAKLFAETKGFVDAGGGTPFVAHVGDLVEGLCGTEEMARVQCQAALGLVDDTKFGVPFHMAKGNHDITGPGAVEAFGSILSPAVSSSEKDPNSASYIVDCGRWATVFFDCYAGGVAWAEQALASRAGRPVLFVLHEPVVPYNARANWIAFARASQAGERQRLLNLLGSRRAVVLSGHLHKYSALVRQTETGRFVQLAVCSVVPSADVAPRDVLDGVENYTDALLDLEPKFSPSSHDERKNLIVAEKSAIRHFEYADTAGYAVIRLRGESAWADIYNGLGRRLWKTVALTDLRDSS